MKISNLFIGIVVMSMVTLGMTGFWINAADNYGVSSQAMDSVVMNTSIQRMNSTLSGWADIFQNDQASASAYYPLLAPLTAITYLWSAMTMIPGIIADVTTLGAGQAGFTPWWFAAGMMTIVGLLIIFGIMAYSQRYSP